jgi:hypothetical protein
VRKPLFVGEVHRIGDVETSEDMVYERREWVVQRIAWAVMAGFVGAAFVGVFGDGPAASARAERAGLSVEYERFARRDNVTRVDIAVRGDAAELWLGAEVLDQWDIEDVRPQPREVRLEPDRLVHAFAAGVPRRVSIVMRPRTVGVHHLRVGFTGGGEVPISQLVFP